MFVVNRSVAIIKPKQAFVDWVNSVSDEGYQFSIYDLSLEHHVMLLPEYDSKEHAEAILKELYKYIFKVELSAWITDESKWPKNKTYEEFLAWFDIELYSMVFDPFENNIEKEPYKY